MLPPKGACASLRKSLGRTESYAFVFLKNRVRKLFSSVPENNGFYEETDRLEVYLLEALPAHHQLATIYKEHYIHRPDGSIGHFTFQGNAEVAKIIAEALKEKGMMKNGG